jgi:serine/threonine protein kinase
MTEETIFLTALEKGNAAERAAYLDEVCAGEPALRERVEALLRSHADPDSFLNVPALPRTADERSAQTRTFGHPGGQPEPKPVRPDEAFSFLAPPTEPGSLGRLDQYEVLEVVGQGGMGVVFKARDTKLQRIVAIKVLAAQLSANGAARKRFTREAQATAAVRDDHVVSIHAVSDDGPISYLVMEFIDGRTLSERVKREGPLGVKEVLRIGLQAARGLAAAHAQGLIHRDITPRNILLENGVQRVKLIDFGLVRAVDDANRSQEGLIAGTPLYMSPEQARGEPAGPRSDLFSLGSVMYMMCTGGPAFPAGNTAAVLKRVCEDAPRPIRTVNPEVPDWLASIVQKLMAKEPADRFQSAAELADVLAQRLTALQQPESRATPTPAASRVKHRRFLSVAVLLGIVGSVACLGLALFLSHTWPFSPGNERGGESPPRDDRVSTNPQTAPEPLPPPSLVDLPGVLTVSKKADNGGRFRSINEALEKVEPGMTIRVIDDGAYEEYLLINRPEQFRGVVLETSQNASLCTPPSKPEGVKIQSVADFTIRGFRLQSTSDRQALVHITGSCPGIVLDRLDITAKGSSRGIYLYDVPLSNRDTPIIIQNCILHDLTQGVVVEGRVQGAVDRHLASGGLVVRNNTLLGCHQPVALVGQFYQIMIVGNRITDAKYAAIDLIDPVGGTADILVANNTLWRNLLALRISDDHARGKGFLKCKNIRWENNLVLEPGIEVDMVFIDHVRGDLTSHKTGDLSSLLRSPEWRFGHNWREMVPPKKDSAHVDEWIPPGPSDRLQVPIRVESHSPGQPQFLRPPKDSPLARAGAGALDNSTATFISAIGQAASRPNAWAAGWMVESVRGTDSVLPPYVGAVPPEGVEPWDWDRTWKASSR